MLGMSAALEHMLEGRPLTAREAAVLGEQVQAGLIAGIHLEGPWLSPMRCGAHEPSALRSPELAEVERVFAAAKGGVRMVTIAPELDVIDVCFICCGDDDTY